ncbi:MAG: DNA-binding protein [Candidatus Diapherotrites archaeon]|nr:DNA-binding protein [Candidatus Diapherotrites archaeon]MDN5367036.1 DNA-binding protein [Candidatus Diapherotrites archaeon]
MGELQLAPVDRLIRKAGAERVSDKAVEVLANILEDLAKQITEAAVQYARHAKRKTITAEDIKLAAKALLG